MLKIKLQLFIGLLIISVSCNTKENKIEKFNPKIIDIISKEDFNYPSTFTPFLFFGKCESNKVAILHVQELKMIHELQYRDLEFVDFLNQILNQSIIINCSENFYFFYIDSRVNDVYRKEGFIDFSKQFCDVIDSNTLMLKKNITKNQRNSIFYFFFRHNYLSYFDDKTGRYYLRNTSYIINNN